MICRCIGTICCLTWLVLRLFLAIEPYSFLLIYPFSQVILGFLIGLNQDGIVVEFEVAHGLDAGEDRLDAVKLGNTIKLGFVRVTRGSPTIQSSTGLQ